MLRRAVQLKPAIQWCAQSRSMSRIVDVWTNPPERALLEGVPEVADLLVKAGGTIPPKRYDWLGE